MADVKDTIIVVGLDGIVAHRLAAGQDSLPIGGLENRLTGNNSWLGVLKRKSI